MQLSNLKVWVAYDVHLGTTNFLKLKCKLKWLLSTKREALWACGLPAK